MANALYTLYKSELEDNSDPVDWTADTIKGVLCTSAYTCDIDGDEFLSDVTSGAQIVAATITGISVLNGVVKVSGSITFSPGSSGDVLEQLVLYKDTGTDSTSRLLAFFDTFSSGMPVTTAGVDITVNFNTSGIFAL